MSRQPMLRRADLKTVEAEPPVEGELTRDGWLAFQVLDGGRRYPLLVRASECEALEDGKQFTLRTTTYKPREV